MTIQLTRSLTLAILGLLLVLPLAAQPVPELEGPSDGMELDVRDRRGHHGFNLRRLARILELTDQQIADTRALLERLRVDVEPLHAELRTLHTELRDALEADAPDPLTVGELVIEIHGVRGEVGAARESFHQEFLALLTPEQRELYERLRDERPGRERRGPGRHHGG